jgi:hypothetical protein
MATGSRKRRGDPAAFRGTWRHKAEKGPAGARREEAYISGLPEWRARMRTAEGLLRVANLPYLSRILFSASPLLHCIALPYTHHYHSSARRTANAMDDILSDVELSVVCFVASL